LSAGPTTTVSLVSFTGTWTTLATSGEGRVSDTGVGRAAGGGEVGGGADTEAEGGGGDGVILRRFGALSPSPLTASSSLPRLSSRGLSVVIPATAGGVGAAARSSPPTMDGFGAATAGEGGTDVDEDGTGSGAGAVGS